MSLATPTKLRKLQRALYVTAKQDPARRFHVLYDKVWREDILAHAFALSRGNGGAPGVDGVSFSQIETYSVVRWLGELREEVRTGRYTPRPVRRVMILLGDSYICAACCLRKRCYQHVRRPVTRREDQLASRGLAPLLIRR